MAQKTKLQQESYQKLQKIISLANDNTGCLAKTVPEAFLNLRRVFDDIVDNGQLTYSKGWKYFLIARERFYSRHQFLKNKIYETEGLELNAQECLALLHYPDLDHADEDVACEGMFVPELCVDLVKGLNNVEPGRIKKCPICKDFFLADHIKREVCYPPKNCEKIRAKEYHKEDMRKRRDTGSDKFDSKYI